MAQAGARGGVGGGGVNIVWPFADKRPRLPQGLRYAQDGLWTLHNSDFLATSRFKDAYGRGVEVERDLNNKWRMHVLFWAAAHGLHIVGDFVECGTNRGFCSAAVMHFIDWNDQRGERRFFLLDTFNGLRPDLVSDEEKAIGRLEMFKDSYPECFEQTKLAFSGMSGVELVRGTIPDTLATVTPPRVAFLHIDMNCAAPEIAALRHFWPRLSPGAIVVLDDYAYDGYEPQKRAIDALAVEFGVLAVSLPTGQGLLIRP